MRDDEEIGEKAPNERRILILGDSLVLAVQVPFGQTFGELLERRLNSRESALHYRVINGGVQGYGPVQELLFLRSLLPVVKPDLIVETLFVGNDIEDAFGAEPLLDPRQRPVTDAIRAATITRLRRIVRSSMVLQVLRLRVLAATRALRGRPDRPEAPLQSYAARPAPRIGRGLAVIHRVGAADAAARERGRRSYRRHVDARPLPGQRRRLRTSARRGDAVGRHAGA